MHKERVGGAGLGKKGCMDSSQSPEHTTPKVNEPKANQGLRVTTTCQCRVSFITKSGSSGGRWEWGRLCVGGSGGTGTPLRLPLDYAIGLKLL